MAQPFLEQDMNFVQRAPLEITKLGADLNIIAKLDDEPNDVGGLTSEQLKAEFDKAGNVIKTYLNDTLIPELLAEDAVEQGRVEAENSRVAAEQARVTAEQERVTAEQKRVQAEQQRIAEEEGRVAAETSRVSAEEARVIAEQARADRDTGIVAQATEQAVAADASAKAAALSQQEAGASASAASNFASAAEQGAQSSKVNAEQASAFKDDAQKGAQESKSWAVGGTGTRPGEDTDNAQYWAEQARNAAGGGVSSFNGRTGAITPKANDYTADMVGARPDTWTPTAEDVGARPDSWTPTAADVGAIPTADKGKPNGVPSLDGEGKVPQGQLPQVPGASRYTSILSTTWTKDPGSGISTQTISIHGITAAQTVIVSADYTGDDKTFVAEKNQLLQYVTNGRVESIDGGVKFSIYGEQPTIPIHVLVIAFNSEA